MERSRSSSAGSTEDSPAEEALILAAAGLRQFLRQPRHAQTLTLLMMREVGGISRVTMESNAAEQPVIEFDLQDNKGQTYHCRCNPAPFAMLLFIIVCGQSVFVDHANGHPYVKVFGRKEKSAGTVFARLVAGAEAEEDFTYANGDRLDLTFRNIVFCRRNPRTANGTPAIVSEILAASVQASSALFGETPEERFEDAKALLDAARSRVVEEREEMAAA